ncbi:hypothetical protein KIW84_051383 [Lathyrus oleraceus]|uniref:DUF7745 domain-containing protein n=1 Tax=Pisum sativum TaxID=3888 RepID=A0A9D5ADM0_PEA|nr:hypothetical protein KIW84_051383 [Pisum sativum]
MGMGQKIKPKYLAMTLGISPEDLLSHYKEDRDAQGLRRGYLEEVSRRMAEAERWGSYIDVVALIMFGIILFPNLGHPIWEWPKEAEIEEFILHGGEASYIELLRKVTWACEKVHVKDNKPKSKDTSSEESYTPWIKERVRLVKLHFIIDPAYVPDMPNLITVSTKEVDRLKSNIARLEQYKESLEHNIYDATYEKTQISYDLEQKDKQLLENMEELWTERSKRKRLWEVYSVSELTLKISMVS